MKRFVLAMLALGLLCGLATATLAQESNTTAIVSVSSIGELKKDVEGLRKLMGIEGAGVALEMLEMGEQMFDATKPLGLVTQVKADGNFRQILFLPAKKFDVLMDMITAPLAGSEEVKLEIPDDKLNGTWTLELPTPVGQYKLHAKKVGIWAVLTNDPAVFGAMPADPAVLLQGLNKKYDFAARATIKNIPKARRAQGIAGLQMAAQMLSMQMGDDPNAATIQAATKQAIQQITELSDQLDELLMGIKIDGADGTLTMDFSASAVEGTQLASQFAAVKAGMTEHSGFDLPGAAATGNWVAKLTDLDVEEMTKSLKQGHATALAALRAEGLADEQLELATDLLNNIADVLQKQIDSRTVDGGMVMTLAPGKASIAFGGTIAGGDKLERVVKDLAGVIAEENKELAKALKFDAETHEGVKFHVFSMPVPDEEIVAMMGKTLNVAVAIGGDSFFVAAGTDPVGLVKQVLDKSKADGKKEVLPMRVALSATPIVKYGSAVAPEGPPKATFDALLNVLQKSAGKDRLVVTSNPITRGSLIRVEVESGVMRLIGIAAQIGGAMAGESIPGAEPAIIPLQ